jgi:hypothetical protein
MKRVCCLDFEASALGERSYPIEAAVVDCDTLECHAWLIRPSPRWLSEGIWSAEAAGLHRISMEELLGSGRPISQVAAELAECCRGKRVLCDGGEHDQRWLTTLFAGAGRNAPIALEDSESFVLQRARGTCHAERVMQVISERGHLPAAHRASADARALAETVRAVLAAIRIHE